MAMLDGRPEDKSFLNLAVAGEGSPGGGAWLGDLFMFYCQLLPSKQLLKGLECPHLQLWV